jgi:hypothetical protein
MSHHIRKLFTGVLYIFAWLVFGFAVGVSLVGFLSQAVRTSRRRSFKNNIDVLIIITAYSIVVGTPHPVSVVHLVMTREGLDVVGILPETQDFNV